MGGVDSLPLSDLFPISWKVMTLVTGADRSPVLVSGVMERNASDLLFRWTRKR